jgi:hypothetical protein
VLLSFYKGSPTLNYLKAMNYGKNELTVDRVKDYLNRIKFSVNYKARTFSVGGGVFNLSAESLHTSLDGFLNVVIPPRKNSKEKMQKIPIYKYLNSYDWLNNPHKYPVYEPPTVTFKEFSRDQLMDERLQKVFNIMYSIYNRDDYHYLNGWVSAVLNEGQTQSAPIIMGTNRTGKDATTTTLYYKLFSPWTAGANNFDDVINDNANLDYKRFVVLSDPSTVLDKKDAYNNLKKLTTSLTYQRKQKYEKTFEIDNNLNFIFTTNETKCTYTTINDPRIKFIPVSNRYKAKKEVWNEYFKIINNAEIQDKLRFILKNWKYDIHDIRNEETKNSLYIKLSEEINSNTTFKSFVNLIKKYIDNNKIEPNYLSKNEKTLSGYETSAKIEVSNILKHYNQMYHKVQNVCNIDWEDYPFVNSYDKRKGIVDINVQMLLDIVHYEPTFENNDDFDYQRDVLEFINFDNPTDPDDDNNPDGNDYKDTDDAFDDSDEPDDDDDNDEPDGDDETEAENSDDSITNDDITNPDIEPFDTNNPKFTLYWGVKKLEDPYCSNRIQDRTDIEYEYINNAVYSNVKTENGKMKRLKNADCEFMNLLFEFDDIPIPEQDKLIERSGLIARRCVYSGNKSNHYIFTFHKNYVDMVHEDDRSKFYHYLWNIINDTYFEGKADKQCCNNARLTRHPGGINHKTGKVQELKYIKPYVIKINNIDDLIKQFLGLKKEKGKVSKKTDKLNEYGPRWEMIIDRILNDEMFAFVWKGNKCPEGKGMRNKYKQHFTGVCKGYGMTQEQIEPYIVECFGSLDGENSIDTLFND